MSGTIICTTKPSKRLDYLVGGLESKTDLPGCTGASRTSRASPSSPRYSTSTSSSESAMQLLPPANLRSSSPSSCNTNGSTLRAQYRQLYAADFHRREDDRTCTQLMSEGQRKTSAGSDNRYSGKNRDDADFKPGETSHSS